MNRQPESNQVPVANFGPIRKRRDCGKLGGRAQGQRLRATALNRPALVAAARCAA